MDRFEVDERLRKLLIELHDTMASVSEIIGTIAIVEENLTIISGKITDLRLDLNLLAPEES